MEVRTYVHQYAIHIHAIMQDTIAVDMQQKEKKILVSDGVPDPAVSRVLLKRKDKQPFQTAARAENLSRSLKMCRKNTIYQYVNLGLLPFTTS